MKGVKSYSDRREAPGWLSRANGSRRNANWGRMSGRVLLPPVGRESEPQAKVDSKSNNIVWVSASECKWERSSHSSCVASWWNDDVPISGSSRGLKLRLVQKQGLKDLKTWYQGGSHIGLLSGSNQEIGIQVLLCPHVSYDIDTDCAPCHSGSLLYVSTHHWWFSIYTTLNWLMILI